jgi:hypothetical protein
MGGCDVLQFELTADDYVAANDLSARWSQARWLRTLLIAVALIGMGLWKLPNEPERALIMVALYLSALTLIMLSYR